MNQPDLAPIAAIIYQDNASYGEVLQATKAYRQLLYNATEINMELPEATADTFTTSGKAIASKWAGMCVDDFLRTQRFCKGVLKAVTSRKQESNEIIHIVYAGTGPFAALVLPLTTRFSAEEICFTLLEVNDYSFKMLKKTIAYFKLDAYVRHMEQCDATDYEFVNPQQVDILLTETMTHALKSEHQVAISYRMLSQLPESTILIPEEISLNLVAVDAEILDRNQKSLDPPIPYFERLGNFFTLNKKEIRKFQDEFNMGFPNFNFPEVSIIVPPNSNMKYHYLSVETRIHIYEDEVLEIDDSGLTSLMKLVDFNPLLTTVSAVAGRYICGQNPGLQCRLIQ